MSQVGQSVQDNFELSSLRATRSLRYAMDQGFSSEHLFVKAASSNEVGQRTLSLLVETLGSTSPNSKDELSH